MLATSYLFTGQLAIPIGLHITWNLFQGSVFGFPVSGSRFSQASILEIKQFGPNIWTGGLFGPEGGLLGTAAILAGIFIILAWTKYRIGTLNLNRALAQYKPHSPGKSLLDPVQGRSSAAKTHSRDRKKEHHLIWDWNGTLLDDIALCLEIINSMLEDRELPLVSRERYLDVFDFPVRNYYQRLGFQFSLQPFEEVSTEFITAYELRRGECQLMQGADRALQLAADLGYTQSILSASKKEYLLMAVQDYGIEDYFLSVLGLDNHHASGKLQLAKDFFFQNNLEPQQTVMIGDTTHDAAIASALGIHCILIPNGHHSRERLEQTGVQLVDSVTSIPEILKQSLPEN
jgi:phosphoglycolate phosphatase